MLTCTQWKISLLICSNFATSAWIFSDKQNTTICLRDFSSSEPLFSIYQYFPNSQLSNRRQPAGRRTTPKPRIHLPYTQASRPLNRSTATRHSCAECSAPNRNTYASTGVCIHVHARTHRHTGTRVHTEICQYRKHIHGPMYTYTCQHTDAQAHTHSTSIIWRCREDSEPRSPSQSLSSKAVPTVRS